MFISEAAVFDGVVSDCIMLRSVSFPPSLPGSIQLLSATALSLLDLLIDSLQLFLQHDGQSLNVRLSARGQQLGAKPMVPVVVVVGATHIDAVIVPGPQQSTALPVGILLPGSKTEKVSHPTHKYFTIQHLFLNLFLEMLTISVESSAVVFQIMN